MARKPAPAPAHPQPSDPTSTTSTTSTTSPSSSTISLSLPSAHYAKLSPRSFLASHLPTTRPSGRTPPTTRPPSINTSSLTHAHGSAVVRLGATAVVCGVRGEILDARDTSLDGAAERRETAATTTTGSGDGASGDGDGDGDGGGDADTIAELGLLVPNIELATGCNPLYMPGNPPTGEAQSLTQRVLTLLRVTGLVGLEGLRIREKEGEERKVMAYWTLYIDILVISLDGSAFDAAWGAVVAALRDTRLPGAWWDPDADGVLCDPRPESARGLRLRGLPIALSFVVFESVEVGDGGQKKKQSYVLADPDDFEESCCEEGITIVVDEGGRKLWRIEKSGGGGLGMQNMKELVVRAGERWSEWRFVVNTTARI